MDTHIAIGVKLAIAYTNSTFHVKREHTNLNNKNPTKKVIILMV